MICELRETIADPTAHPVLDLVPPEDSFREEVVRGLQAVPKQIPSKFFYDERGSQLFDEITQLEEYYLTRTEIGILHQHIGAIVARIGLHALLVEYGSGSSLKTRIMLDHLMEPAGYVPIDISKDHLLHSAAALATAYPDLAIQPIAADYSSPLTLPEWGADNVVVFFPGSTLGNFTAGEAEAFLNQVAHVVGPGGGLLLGVDLKKDRAVLEAAYNDRKGITAAFNKNLLERINKELEGTFDLDQFTHEAFYNETEGRIEMHLRSRRNQVVQVGSDTFSFLEGETICTEYSHKYSLDDIERLTAKAGFSVEEVWMDEQQWFAVLYLVAH